MSMGLRGVWAAVVNAGIDTDESGEGPQRLLDLLLVPTRNPDQRGLPQMLERVVDESVRCQGVLDHELVGKKRLALRSYVSRVDCDDRAHRDAAHLVVALLCIPSGKRDAI